MRTSIIVQNLRCGGCAKTITNKLSDIQNIANVEVDIDNATISFTAAEPENALEVKRRLKSLGYPTASDANGALLKAKSFVSCAAGKISK